MAQRKLLSSPTEKVAPAKQQRQSILPQNLQLWASEGGEDFYKHYPGIRYMSSLDELEQTILSY